MGKLTFYQKVYAVVRHIPRGKVATYGQIARMLENPRASRAVGYAMRALSSDNADDRNANLPWQRLVNSRGELSLKGPGMVEQAGLLQDEGVTVSADFRIDLKVFAWEGLLPHEVEKILAEEEEFYD